MLTKLFSCCVDCILATPPPEKNKPLTLGLKMGHYGSGKLNLCFPLSSVFYLYELLIIIL